MKNFEPQLEHTEIKIESAPAVMGHTHVVNDQQDSVQPQSAPVPMIHGDKEEVSLSPESTDENAALMMQNAGMQSLHVFSHLLEKFEAQEQDNRVSEEQGDIEMGIAPAAQSRNDDQQQRRSMIEAVHFSENTEELKKKLNTPLFSELTKQNIKKAATVGLTTAKLIGTISMTTQTLGGVPAAKAVVKSVQEGTIVGLPVGLGILGVKQCRKKPHGAVKKKLGPS